MLPTRETTLTFFVKYLSPLKPKSCAGQCLMQEGQLLHCSFSSYTPEQIPKPNFCAHYNFLVV